MWINLEIIILSEVSQKRKTNIIWSHLYVKSKIRHKWTCLRNKNRLTDIENRLVVAKGEGGRGGVDWEFGTSRCKLLNIGWINYNVLLSSTGNYIQYPVISHNGKEKILFIGSILNWAGPSPPMVLSAARGCRLPTVVFSSRASHLQTTHIFPGAGNSPLLLIPRHIQIAKMWPWKETQACSNQGNNILSSVQYSLNFRRA